MDDVDDGAADVAGEADMVDVDDADMCGGTDVEGWRAEMV